MNITLDIQCPTGRFAILIIAAFITLVSCSPTRSLVALARSTDHFVPFSNDDRIRIEPGADEYAFLISSYVDDSIKKVEESHYASFVSPPTIFVCATKDSMYRLTGQRAPACATTKIFFSQELFQEQRPIDRYLTHEMSHLHLVQRLGLLGMMRIPAWFKEGLAEMVSGGALASLVSVSEAIKAINEGHHFVPDEGRNVISSFLFPQYGSYWHMENSMFYRQAMLFVSFMRTVDEEAFKRFLVNIEGGVKFRKALNDAYPGGVSILWDEFMKENQNEKS